MSYFLWDSARWFGSALCCLYAVVQFGKLRVPICIDAGTTITEWHWALGLFTDGQFQVFGAWHDEGPETAQRIAQTSTTVRWSRPMRWPRTTALLTP